MTDGAGWVSRSVAENIRLAKGLLYPPAAFQGRIGSAKGLWRVEFDEKRKGDWIDISDSQRKWEDREDNTLEANHPCHRTFEVLECVHPLKPGKLSSQMLPIFMSQALNPKEMRETLHNLNEQGLKNDLDKINEAFKDPALLQHWAYASNPNIKEKLRAGEVPNTAGMPTCIQDQIQALAEGGFTPVNNAFLRDRTYKLLNASCDKLKEKLGIPIPRSTNVYITPDRRGILKSGEVFLQFSNIVDEESGICGEQLVGRELLIARSPAHFASDIQRVKVVAKEELMGYQNIMICSTKGHNGGPSIADFLSGGDFDGDKVFAVWEPKIVGNFNDVDIPEKPDLVKEGFIRKDSITYDELTKNHSNPTLHWLTYSFNFQMRPQMLGRCTVKTDCVYIQGLLINQMRLLGIPSWVS